MPEIDVERGPRLFAILDEGCNEACHTTTFAAHAEEVLAATGRSMGELGGVV